MGLYEGEEREKKEWGVGREFESVGWSVIYEEDSGD